MVFLKLDCPSALGGQPVGGENPILSARGTKFHVNTRPSPQVSPPFNASIICRVCPPIVWGWLLQDCLRRWCFHLGQAYCGTVFKMIHSGPCRYLCLATHIEKVSNTHVDFENPRIWKFPTSFANPELDKPSSRSKLYWPCDGIWKGLQLRLLQKWLWIDWIPSEVRSLASGRSFSNWSVPR